MGARKKTKPRTARRPAVDLEDDDDDSDVTLVVDEPGNFLTRAFFRPTVLLVLAGIAMIWFGGKTMFGLLPDLSRRPEYCATAASVRVNEPPVYIPANFVADAFEKASLSGELSLLDADVVERVAQALRAHPWVQEVVRIRKQAPEGLIAELRYRKPAAMVVLDDRIFPIDTTGVLLPADDFIPEDAKQYPLVENVRTKPSAPGTSWGDPKVAGAAKLAEALTSCWERLEFASIYIVESGNEGSGGSEAIYELRTRGGSRIIWGRAPGSDHPGELSTEQKLGRLEKYRADFGRFDQPHGPYEIDIRHWQEISRRPISASRTREYR